jgi:hypothetical protein
VVVVGGTVVVVVVGGTVVVVVVGGTVVVVVVGGTVVVVVVGGTVVVVVVSGGASVKQNVTWDSFLGNSTVHGFGAGEARAPLPPHLRYTPASTKPLPVYS